MGAYEILEEIAQGGMGAVYRAQRADGQYKQEVALKIIRAELGGESMSARLSAPGCGWADAITSSSMTRVWNAPVWLRADCARSPPPKHVAFSYSKFEGEGRMRQGIFRLNASTMAILSYSSQRTIVTVPEHSMVTVFDGDVDGYGFVKIRYQKQVLDIFALDLRNRGERVFAQMVYSP